MPRLWRRLLERRCTQPQSTLTHTQVGGKKRADGIARTRNHRRRKRAESQSVVVLSQCSVLDATRSEDAGRAQAGTRTVNTYRSRGFRRPHPAWVDSSLLPCRDRSTCSTSRGNASLFMAHGYTRKTRVKRQNKQKESTQ